MQSSSGAATSTTGGSGSIVRKLVIPATSTWTMTVLDSTVPRVRKLAVRDMFASGRLDIVAMTTGAASCSITVYRNNGSGSFTSSVVTNTLIYPATLHAGDVNADNRTDLLIGLSSSAASPFLIKFSYTIGASGTVTWAQSAIDPSLPAVQHGVLADMNQDGYNDFLVTSTSTNILYYYQVNALTFRFTYCADILCCSCDICCF
jgi:FG-GAP-like repeat